MITTLRPIEAVLIQRWEVNYRLLDGGQRLEAFAVPLSETQGPDIVASIPIPTTLEGFDAEEARLIWLGYGRAVTARLAKLMPPGTRVDNAFSIDEDDE